MCTTNVYKMRPIIYQSNMCIVAINRTQSSIPFPCLNFSENKSWQDNFFRIQKTGNAFMFIIYNNEWQHILPFPSFSFIKKSVEQKQNMSFVPILAINFGSHRINNCVNIFPSRDYPTCVFLLKWRATLTLLTRIMPYPHSCYTILFSLLKQHV